MSSLPIKIAIAAGHPMAVPSLNALIAQGKLSGVILPPLVDMFSTQLENWLRQQNIPCLRIQANVQTGLEQSLRRWETDLVLTFGFENISQHFAAANGIRLFDISVDHSPYQAVKECYSQVRLIAQEKTQVRQVVLSSFEIHPNDTSQALLNRITSQSLLVIEEFIERVQHDVLGDFEPLTVVADDVWQPPYEQELLVDWQAHNSETISAMARAGNPHSGGCIVVIANTPVSLLEAIPVTHQTYGVQPGTICHVGEPEGVIVATVDGAIKMNVLSTADGIFGGISFCECFQINAGMAFDTKPPEVIHQ